MPVCINGSVALVTGAARGIGAATAMALGARGARVVVADIDSGEAARIAEQIPGESRAVELDVGDSAAWRLLLAEIGDELGRVDILVNNAGIMPVGLIVEEAEAVARRQFEVNVHGVLNGVKSVLPGMLERGSGHIVNVASGAGKTAYAGGATYCATKHAVVGFTESLRYETAGTGVSCSLVMPGLVRTELTSGLAVPRGVKPVEPADVAAAIAGAVERDRFEVYVPRSLGPATRTLLAMPRAVRDKLRARVGADDFMTQVDHDARGAYERRTA